MSDSPESADQGQNTEQLIARANRGDPDAFDDLLLHVSTRLCAIAHRMLCRYPQVRRWEETDDVMQGALMRLHRSLTEVKPDSVGRFFGLAATILRRTLIDLSRHYCGVYGMGTQFASAGNGKSGDGRPEPLETVVYVDPLENLEGWTAFHEGIEQLPESEKEAFSLMWYSGLTQRQIGQVLGVSERTVIRRMNRARIRLNELLADRQPSF